jgi:hypothetical protein
MWPSPTTVLNNQAAPRLSLEQLRRRERRTVAVCAGYALGGTALAAMLFLAAGSPIIGAAAIGGILLALAVLVWLWKRPVRGAYVLFGAAVLLATYVQPGLTDYIGVPLPFFRDIKSYTGTGLVFSVAEVFMALVFLVWLLKGIAERNLRFDRGSLMLPVGLYSLMVLVGEFRGLTSGGDFKVSLFELRSQIYLLIAYVLICNLVKSRSQITKLLWILLIGAGLRGIEGTIQFLFVLRAQDISTHELYPHEQSYFFNGFLTLTLILSLYGGSRRMKRVALFLLPFVGIADLGNNRRASVAALVISILVLLLVTWLVQPRHRRVIGWCLLTLAIAYTPYFLAYENKTGSLALPARAIASTFHPNANDAASNQYRIFEDLDIMSTVKSSSTAEVIGYGFGKPMSSPYPLPNINYVFQYIMPHNSILWVWMRLGTIGYLLLWFMVGTAVVQVTQLVRRLRDPFLQGVALFVLLMLLQQVIISYVDLQWSNYRTMIMTGVLFALISRLGAFAVPVRLSGQRASQLAMTEPTTIRARWQTQKQAPPVTRVQVRPNRRKLTDDAEAVPLGISPISREPTAPVDRISREALIPRTQEDALPSGDERLQHDNQSNQPGTAEALLQASRLDRGVRPWPRSSRAVPLAVAGLGVLAVWTGTKAPPPQREWTFATVSGRVDAAIITISNNTSRPARVRLEIRGGARPGTESYTIPARTTIDIRLPQASATRGIVLRASVPVIPARTTIRDAVSRTSYGVGQNG